MIDRVRVIGFKSLADVEVRLRPLTVLIGPNAAGKSNLLAALSFIANLFSGQTVKEALQRGAPFEVFHFPDDAGGRALLPQDRAEQPKDLGTVFESPKVAALLAEASPSA